MDTTQLLGVVENRYPSPAPSSRSLPEDDGMRALRLKVHEIRNLAASTHEKARAMHLLMTREYLALNSEHPTSLSDAPAQQVENPHNLTPQDLEPTHCPDHFDGQGATLGCEHYSRNVKVQCYDCSQWHTCRHCHDASPNLPFPHILNRKMTRNMLCMLCKTAQPAGPVCNSCGEDTAYYFCPKCKLWDNDSTKRIYHCDDCGICRRGEGLGKDYVHCKRCNVCISISTSSTHPCVERATDCNCPLCLDYLFSSPAPVVSLACGHYMHAGCYKDLMNVTYRCPVCNKSAVNMELQWRKLDDEIRLQPMPEEEFEDFVSDLPNPERRKIPRKVFVGCNDCGGRGWTHFHWLGLKCGHCDGYNTSQTSPMGSEAGASRPIVRQHDFAGVNVLRIVSDEDRADSAYGCPSTSPSQRPIQQQPQPIVVTPHSPAARSYFLQAEYEESLRNTERALSAGDAFRNLPYDIISRFRSLSPMRFYLEGLDVRGDTTTPTTPEAATETEKEGQRPRTAELRESFWGPEGMGVFFGEDYDDDEEEEDEEEEDEEEEDESDDDSVGSEGEDVDADFAAEDDMNLPGHL